MRNYLLSCFFLFTFLTSVNSQNDISLFNDYDWLISVVDVDDCEGQSVSEFDFGSYQFIYVDKLDVGYLYIDDGSLYCQDFIGFSCLDAYGLSNPMRHWECEECICPAVFDPVCGVDGITYSNACEAECAGVNIAFAGSCDSTETEIFVDFPFLTNIIDENNCQGTSILIYNFANNLFPFVVVNGLGTLYSNTGQLYCQDFQNFSCVDAYGLGSPVSSWTCDDCGCPQIIDNLVCGADGNIYSSECEAQCAGTTVVECSSPDLFTEFPWLSSFFDPSNCDNETVTVYQSGNYIYLLITQDNTNTLYDSQGNFYCQDFPGFSCTEAYGFTDSMIINSWSCDITTSNEVSCSSAFITVDRPQNFNLDPNGPYFENEVLTVCYFLSFNSDPIGLGNNCAWLQGIVPSLKGPWKESHGWLVDSYSPSGWNEQYGYEGDEVFYQLVNDNIRLDSLADGSSNLTYDEGNGNLTPGSPLPWGWWSTSPGTGADCGTSGHPNDSWGIPASCGSTTNIEFCFDIQVGECNDPNGQEISLSIFAFSDTETGCFSSNVCDDPPAEFKGRVMCTTAKNTTQIERRRAYSEVYPNPTSGIVNVTIDEVHEDQSMSIYNLEGKMVKVDPIVNSVTNTYQLDLSNQPKGIYFIHLGNGESQEVKKVILF